MTRKDYVRFAEMLKANKPQDGEEGKHLWWQIVQGMACECKRDNAAFDHSKFYTACGFKG